MEFGETKEGQELPADLGMDNFSQYRLSKNNQINGGKHKEKHSSPVWHKKHGHNY